MADPTTKEAVQLMMGPPIQIAHARLNRAKREGRPTAANHWEQALKHFQEGLQICVQAASVDTPLKS